MTNKNVYKMGPWTHNIIHTFVESARYSDFIKTFNNMGLYVETDMKNKSVIIEIPREDRQQIRFKELLKCKEFKNTNYKLPIIMGVNVFGNPIIKELDKMPHLLITGRTGSGKSLFMQNIYESLSKKLNKDECQFVIVDLKGIDFNGYSKKKNMVVPVITECEEVFKIFDKISEIIDYRENILHGKKQEKMPKIVIIIDEFADLVAVNKKRIEQFIQLIAQKGRRVGIHLIISTQCGHSYLTNVIKANMPTRICMQTRSKEDSIKSFGESGAELLVSPGDMLYSEAGRVAERIHCAFNV